MNEPIARPRGGVPGYLTDFLAKIADGQPALHYDLPLVRLLMPTEQAKGADTSSPTGLD